MANLFLARGVKRVTEPTCDDIEEQELIELSRKQMETALERGKFKIVAWVTAVALALRHGK
jgi:hypothetical protein